LRDSARSSTSSFTVSIFSQTLSNIMR
jgi:hypothetical protein